MKKLLPLLLLLLLIGAGIAGWRLLGRGGASDRVALAPGDLVAPPVQEETGATALAQPKVAAVEREEAVTPVSAAAPIAKTEVQKPGPSAVWVEGRVVFPPDTPIDELAFVVAKGKRLSGKKSSREYRALVGQDGRFRVALGKGTKKARLSLEARYLKLAETLKFSPDPEEELVLEPILGGRILARFERADGAAWTEEDAEELELGVRDTDSDSWQTLSGRRVRLADGSEELDRFEFGGATPGSDYALSTTSPIFVTETLDDVAVLAGETEEVTFSMRLGARVKGRIVDLEGQGIANADIRASYETENYSQTQFIRSDEDGVFDKGGLEPAETNLFVKADGFLDGEMELGMLTLGQVVDGLVIELGTGRSITGKVQWPDGTAVVKASVRMEDLESEGQWWGIDSNMVTETDLTGSFEFTGLEGDERYRVYTRARRTQDLELEGLSKLKRKRAIKSAPFWNAEIEDVQAGASDLLLTLTSGATFVGTVVDDVGTPLDDFRVFARPAESERSLYSTRTGESVTRSYKDAGGRFELEGLKPGSWVIVVRERGYGTSPASTAQVPGGPLSAKFVLPRDSVVRGRVVDPDGNPIAKAKVECELQGSFAAGGFIAGSHGDWSTRTDEDGRFTMKRVSSGVVEFIAESPVPEFVSAAQVDLEVPPASELEDVVLELRRACRVVVQVHPSLVGRPDLEVNLNELEGPMWENKEPDEEGTAVFERMNPGRYMLTFEIPAAEDALESLLPGGAGDDERQLEFTLAEGENKEILVGEPASVTYTVSGTVLRGGTPVEGAIVQVQTNEDNRNFAARTGTGGAFLVQVESLGVLTFTVRDRETDPGVIFSRMIVAGVDAVFTLDIPVGSIRGTVFDSSGEPAANSTVSLTSDNPPTDDGSPQVHVPVETDELGVFEFVGLVEGEYSIQAKPLRRGWWNRDEDEEDVFDAPALLHGVRVGAAADGPTEVEIRMTEGATLTGLVTRSDGSSPGGFLVYLAAGDGRIDWTVSSRVLPGGSYELKGLPAGEIQVGVRNRQGETIVREARVSLGQENVLDLSFD